MPVGRPTEYKPEVIEKINEYLISACPQNQQIPTIEGLALEIGVSRDTLYEWAKVHPEFSDTLDELKMRQKFDAALQEILQNTWRAGARSVVIEYDPTHHTISFVDDGPGCLPDRILTAGESGWEDPKVNDPAGVGAFSLLRPEDIQRVQYECHGDYNWAMELDQNALAGAPIVVEQLKANGKHGLKLTLTLQPNTIINKEKITAARAYYPIEVIWIDGRNAPEMVETKTEWIATDSFVIPAIGRIELAYSKIGQTSVIWQHVPIQSPIFRKEMLEAAKHHPLGALAKSLVPGAIRLFVDPASAIRAKLPDRNEIINDANLRLAAEKIVAEIIDRMMARLSKAAPQWPEVVENPQSQWGVNVLTQNDPVLADALYDRPSLEIEVLKHFGWEVVSYHDPQYLQEEDDGEVLRVQAGKVIQLVKGNHPVVDDVLLNNSLNAQGIRAIFASGTLQTKSQIIGPITFTNLRFDSRAPWIGFADRIEVNGIEPIIYLMRASSDGWHDNTIRNHPDADLQQLAIIYAGSPSDFLADQDGDLWTNIASIALYHRQNLHTYVGRNNDGLYLETEHIRVVLEQQAMVFIDQRLPAIRKQIARLDGVLGLYTEEQCGISELQRQIRKHLAAGPALTEAIARLQEAAESLGKSAAVLIAERERSQVELDQIIEKAQSGETES